MSDNVNIKQISGTSFWCQLLGEPVLNYNKDGKEWSIDVGQLSEDTQKILIKLGLGPKIKNKGDDRGAFITFKRNSVKKGGPKAGEANKPIKIVGPDGKTEWDPAIKIGNGSEVRVRFSVNEVVGGPAKKKFIRGDILSMQVWKHVPFVAVERSEFEANEDAPVVEAGEGNW